MHLKIIAPALAVLFVAAACSSTSSSTKTAGGTHEGPIKVGVLLSLTGPLSQAGQQLENGIKLAAAQSPALIQRKVDLTVQDDQGKPSTALQKAQSLVTQHGDSSIIGIASSAVGAAIEPQLKSLGAVGMITGAKDTTLTGPDSSPFIFRENRSDAQDATTIDAWLKTQPKLQTWSILGANYNFGHDNADTMKRLLVKNNRKLVSEQFVPLGTPDFGPEITKILAAKPDAVWLAISGQDAVNFIQQAAKFGLTKDTPLAGSLILSNSFVKTLGPAAVGTVGNVQYNVNATNQANTQFTAAYREMFHSLPTNYAFDGYLGMRLLMEGYKQAKGTDPTQLANAVAHVSLPSTAIGPVSMDPKTHQLQAGSFIGKVTAPNEISILSSFTAEQIGQGLSNVK